MVSSLILEQVQPNPTRDFLIPSFSSNSIKVESCFTSQSCFRNVFQTTDDMKEEFSKFLKTIFYQLDDEKVFKKMEEILSDPNKTDQDIYDELKDSIPEMKKNFSPLRQLYSLNVLRAGMGKQAASLLSKIEPKKMNGYAEIYDRRYLNAIRASTGYLFKGKTYAVCDHPEKKVSLIDRIQAGAFFSSYPYQNLVALNDEDCSDPIDHPEKTCKPLDETIPNVSLDMVSCLGGFHHIPEDRIEPFIKSIYRKLKPGAVLLFRDHDVEKGKFDENQLKAIASVVHSFVNAADGVSFEAESKEIRNFKPMKDWIQMMKAQGFSSLNEEKGLVLQDDPTENKMVAFIKQPANLQELKSAVSYRNDYSRPKDDSFATWIEWGNVRLSKEYAAYIQDHHSYAYDYIGAIRQHWEYFRCYIKENSNQNIKLAEFVFSDNFVMNVFILLTAFISNLSSYCATAPSRFYAKWKYGENWRDICQLSTLEKFQSEVELEYSNFIDTIPFYQFPFIQKINNLWKTILFSNDHFFQKIINSIQAVLYSIELMIKAVIALLARTTYDQGADQEVPSVKLIIDDVFRKLNCTIEELSMQDKILKIYETTDSHHFVQVPRYKPFTEIMKAFFEKGIVVKEISNRELISVDVIDRGESIPGFNKLYEMGDLHPQNGEIKKFATYVLKISDLNQFIYRAGKDNIYYIHE